MLKIRNYLDKIIFKMRLEARIAYYRPYFQAKTTQNHNRLITNKLHHIHHKLSLKTSFQQTLKTAFQAQKGSFEHAKA